MEKISGILPTEPPFLRCRERYSIHIALNLESARVPLGA